MRTIKFRGKNGVAWFKGDLEYCPKVGVACIHTYSKDGVYDRSYQVNPDTVGQFTGLLDIHGKEIYEGDIIRCYGSKDDEIKHIVEYSDKEAMFCTKLIGAEMLGGSITQRWLNEFEFEVIGNIYDNPELLKGGEE